MGFYSHASYEAEAYKEVTNYYVVILILLKRNQSRHKQQCEYEKTERDLKAKKENLFLLGDPDKWELDLLKSRGIPQEELIKDKEIAFAVMLDKVHFYIKLSKSDEGKSTIETI